jgi:hypothetical protein
MADKKGYVVRLQTSMNHGDVSHRAPCAKDAQPVRDEDLRSFLADAVRRVSSDSLLPAAYFSAAFLRGSSAGFT